VSIQRIHTKEEYEKGLAELETWMANQDKPAPPNIEWLIQQLVKYEEKHFPL